MAIRSLAILAPLAQVAAAWGGGRYDISLSELYAVDTFSGTFLDAYPLWQVSFGNPPQNFSVRWP